MAFKFSDLKSGKSGKTEEAGEQNLFDSAVKVVKDYASSLIKRNRDVFKFDPSVQADVNNAQDESSGSNKKGDDAVLAGVPVKTDRNDDVLVERDYGNPDAKKDVIALMKSRASEMTAARKTATETQPGTKEEAPKMATASEAHAISPGEHHNDHPFDVWGITDRKDKADAAIAQSEKAQYVDNDLVVPAAIAAGVLLSIVLLVAADIPQTVARKWASKTHGILGRFLSSVARMGSFAHLKFSSCRIPCSAYHSCISGIGLYDHFSVYPYLMVNGLTERLLDWDAGISAFSVMVPSEPSRIFIVDYNPNNGVFTGMTESSGQRVVLQLPGDSSLAEMKRREVS